MTPSSAGFASATAGSATASEERVGNSAVLVVSADTGGLASSAIVRVELTLVRCRVDA